jgi:hypothetical protein
MREEVAYAQPGEVEFALSWLPGDDGRLTGELVAKNISDHAIRLSGKPSLTPIGVDGQPLAAETVVTLELRLPGYVELEPGKRASTVVGWAGWDGPPASGTVIVQWPGGQVDVAASGPRQPHATGPAVNLWASWFTRTD